MSENTPPQQEAENGAEVKKTGLAEAAKRMLELKKQSQKQNGGKGHQSTESQKMKSQLTKKPNNQRRRTGV